MSNAFVVGADGSSAATEAIKWAAHSAELEDRPLRIVTTFQTETSGYAPGLVIPQDVVDAIRDDAQKVVTDAVETAKSVAPGISIETKIFEGKPALVLRDLSEDAYKLVVGSRGLGGVKGLFLGSVSVNVAAHAKCPVVVVGKPGGDGAVVVGIDGSEVSAPAVAEAFKEASFRKAKLFAVHTYTDLAADALYGYGLDEAELQRLSDDAYEALSERLAGFSADYPDVEVERVIVADGPAQRLLDVAADNDAQLIVMGSRGRGGFAGMLLGSTSQSVLHKAQCPVEIVRTETRAS
ncbi:universal stress protein [Gordonia jinhuaensis]|uniref:Universal stress protein n=1 Tax=Gordonia jinhuaensis TaxID=1517702 RepID=A0A916WSA8_9ACTN|nr:universal stress protein [Gordonia jinhuaensis]GGB27979.1 universal stress protein [Gordonia jinhuaensis]